MTQNSSGKPIIEKYRDLHEACLKNPVIILGNEEKRPKKYKEIDECAKGGFIEKFCKLNKVDVLWDGKQLVSVIKCSQYVH